MLKRILMGTALGCAMVAMTAASAQETDSPQSSRSANKPGPENSSPEFGVLFQPQSSTTDGSVSVEGRRVDYKAVAGTLIVHPEGWDDAAWREQAHSDLGDKKGEPKAEASMFYTAYFKKGVPSADRPITFLYNGGPGSATVWLHMGAFGPRRVLTPGDKHMAAAPYKVVNNAYSLLDASDLVFIDAPGTGFSRVAGKDKEKAFFGVDADAHAFAQFIKGFLSKYGRWNSPKYLFGESYGTPRSAVVVNELETSDDIDFNGVILLSQILNFDLSIDTPQFNPGSDQAYIVGLPTYAATAWYHNKLPGGRPAELEPFLKQVEHFATTDYAAALQQGSELDPARKRQVAEQLSKYIGIPASYIYKSDLRLSGGQFAKQLQINSDLTTGRLDSRFSGPAMDPLSKDSDYDPQSASISSAYIAAFNNYVRKDLNYGQHQVYKPGINVFRDWDFSHKQPGMPFAIRGATNVMPDLAMAMKYNPNLKIMLAGGYYDLATPFYEGWYEMHHLPIPDSLQNNISYHYYPSGHMVYAREEDLKKLHDDVASFIGRTDNIGG
ncbi:S10 family peptidase [Stakelama marina]|uniref:Peptidase S10 n=1 Tax=Stakelama marina TaxID=2826939 RepID=A0A8T4IJ99_9SPHN|nr:peptidase S10 [Stakelama marina]MBR0552399.1 peptidase S10 [Stakelama marina]